MKYVRLALYTIGYYLLIEIPIFVGISFVTRGLLFGWDLFIITSAFCGLQAWGRAIGRVFDCRYVAAANWELDWEYVEEYRPSTGRWELERRLVHNHVD
jgi:hypothetical protein